MAIYINRDAPESGIASLLALQGTKGDTELVHMTKPEVKTMMNTGLMSMNKETGLPQFADGQNMFAMLLPMIAGMVFPPLLGPSISAALGTGAVASGAIAGGMGTALAGMMTGDDPADAITKGLLSGGMSYGLGSAFPETFGYGKGAAGEGVPNQGLSAEAGAGTGYDSWGRNVSEYAPSGTLDSSLPDAFSYGMDQQVGVPNVSQGSPYVGRDGGLRHAVDNPMPFNVKANNLFKGPAGDVTPPTGDGLFDIEYQTYTPLDGSQGRFPGDFRHSLSGKSQMMPQKLVTDAEAKLAMVNANKSITDVYQVGEEFKFYDDPALFDTGTTLDASKLEKLKSNFGFDPTKGSPANPYITYGPQHYQNYADEMLNRSISNPPEMLNRSITAKPFLSTGSSSPFVGIDGAVHNAATSPSSSTVDSLSGTSTGDAVGTSWIDKFRNKLPGSMDEAGNRLVDPKSGVFSKQAMATGLSQLGANFLMPEEQEQLTIEQQQQTPYVPNKRDYVYNRKKPSPIDGLTPSQIRELYEKGGLDRRFYEQPSSGQGVFPVAAQSGGGIEDLIEMSETVGISETPFEGMITGDGHGMQDNVMMPILERGGVAAVSPKEYVVPADVMSMIGNGNADSGAEAMDGFISDFRTAKYGRPTQPPQIDGRSALQSLMRT